MFFFSVGEAATSKWTHGEVAVFGSTVYKIFALKCQKLRTPLASLAPCVIKMVTLAADYSYYCKATDIFLLDCRLSVMHLLRKSIYSL